MIDSTRVLRPLDEAAAAIDKLDDYLASDELASALEATTQAVDRTLRNILRADAGTPDEIRLTALSSAELPHDRLIPALRQRNLISLQLAGMVHELEQSARRATEGQVRAADGDHALQVVQRLRSEVSAAGDRPVREVAHQAVESGVLDLHAHAVPVHAERSRLYRNLGLAALFMVSAVLLITLLARDSDFEKGKAAFAAERWDAAAGFFEKAAQDKDNASAQLYLARVYRRQQQYDRAAVVLKDAAVRHNEDEQVWRELGYLFLDLNQPHLAAERFRQAQELNPENKDNWILLVRALRAAGDPSSEQVLQQAPAEVRALLTSH